MNIVMMTNTFTPFVGGVERSVEMYTDMYRRRGHSVAIVAPEQPGRPEREHGVIRVPAICNFNGTDFSVRLPIPGVLSGALKDFKPDVVHSHHPFLIGDTALRVSAAFNVPIVYTFHTFYERYTHYVPGDSPALKRFVVSLTTEYANLCDRVIAPSESVARVLSERGVHTPVDIVPTGIYFDRFTGGDGASFRQHAGVDPDDFVLGFVSRVSPEKNVGFLAEAIVSFCRRYDRARFFLIGTGPSEEDVKRRFAENGMESRLHAFGTLEGQRLVDAYHAADVFVFASQSETQGIVLTEAMAAGLPVVAVDAPGVREVVRDGYNGCLLPQENKDRFVDALLWIARMDDTARAQLSKHAEETARSFSIERCADKALSIYADAAAAGSGYRESESNLWEEAKRRIRVEWELLATKTKATAESVGPLQK